MKKLVCEMCGGADLIKQDGVFVCQNCGTKYSVEEARKMMMEGSVSIEGTVAVEGTVKVDKSEELKKLYTLARRAKEADNTENAVRYYTQIEMQDPDSWEAYFYLIYFKARTTTIGEIHKDCKNLSNCFSTTCNLLMSSVHDPENQRVILRQIIKDVRDFVDIIISTAKSLSDIKDKMCYQASALNMMESLGDSILKSIPAYADIALEAWKSELDAFISEICYGEVDKEVYILFTSQEWIGYVLRNVPLKIYDIDPTYEDPFGVVKELRENEVLITCPKCGKVFREKESSCPECGCTKQEIEQIELEKRQQAEQKAAEARARAEEEERKRAEERAEWWKKNKGKVLVVAVIIIAVIAGSRIVKKISNQKAIALAEQYIASGDSCVAIYRFDEAQEFYQKAKDCTQDPNIQYAIDNQKRIYMHSARNKADEEYNKALRRLKILLDADDYVFNQYSNQALDKMIEIYPDRKETIYYKNLRK